MDFNAKLDSILDGESSEPSSPGVSTLVKQPKKQRPSTWVYLSGPNAYIASGEKACKETGIDYYGARWDI